MRARTFVPCLLAVVWVLAGCAPAAQNTPAPVGGSAPPAQARQSKTLTIALQGEPAALNLLMGGDIGGSPGGQVSLALNERLSTFDNKGIPFAQLATELPSLDKGTWVLNQDGTMQTTYHLRPNVKWHDGQPMTARDIVFGWTVARDTELPVATRDVATLITTIDTPDDATLVMHWSRPYPQAHVLGEIEMAPMPAHLLQETYAADKDKFQRLPYWTTEFVGVGPYRLEKWELGDRFVLKAFDGYYGTHPKIDTLNFVFIGDEAATIAQLFSGAIDGEIRGLQPKSVLQAKRQWEQTGKKPYVSLESVGTRADEVQYRDPKARELTDLRVRRGLLMAIDRQTLGDAVFDTTAPQADGLVPLDDPRYGWMKDSLTSYPYDQRRALQELAAGGWQRGPDGAMVNAAGERVTLSLWTTEGAQWQETQAINADAWRAIGFAVDEFVLPTARARDRELNASFPSFNGAFYGLNYFQPVRIYQSGECASADNRWTGTNRGCYQNPELDRIAQPLVTAVDPAQQQRLWSEFARVFSDQLPALPLYHMPWANMFREGVTGPKGESWRGSGSSGTWNVTEWDIQ